MLNEWIESYLAAQQQTIATLPVAEIEQVVEVVKEAYANDAQIFVCGNGGNAASTSHFAADLGKNASGALPRSFRILALNDNTAWLTALGNDFSYDEVFSRQLNNFANPGDVLITSSVSGNSPNLVEAVKLAKQRGLKTVAIVGGKRGQLADMADHVVVINDEHYGRVEDAQMSIYHMIAFAFVEKGVEVPADS